MTKHRYSDLFRALRDESNLALDGRMAAYEAGELTRFPTGDSAAGCEFAAGIGREHGVEGIRSLYRCLRELSTGCPADILFDEDGSAMDRDILLRLEGKPHRFLLGAELFCELTGVEKTG